MALTMAPMAAGKILESSMGLFWGLVFSATLLYFVVTALVYFFQRRLQYFPDRSPVPLPTGERFEGLAEVELVAADGCRLFGWHWPGTRPLTVLLFHGNAGHRGNRLAWMRELHDRGLAVFCLDYRGYGGSEGSPTEKGFYADATAAVDWLQERDAGELVYLGESIGCGVAVELAVRRPPAALVLQSGFPSVVDVARKVYPIFPVGLLMTDRFDCAGKIGHITCPLLMIHGEKDSIIPMRLGKALFDAAPRPKEWLMIDGADHNDPMWIDPDYMKRIDAFLRTLVSFR